jgi:hypothetical protein
LAEETTHQFLERREQELMAQISALRGQLAPKEAELEQVQRLRAALIFGVGNTAPRTSASDFPDGNTLCALSALSPQSPLAPQTPLGTPAVLLYGHRTIKDLVVQALLDHFPEGGSSGDIRNFIRIAYGRTIEPSSLRPQMHRLKTDEILGHEPSTDTWNFRDGKRALYARYDHPTSRKTMRELQDEPVKFGGHLRKTKDDEN